MSYANPFIIERATLATNRLGSGREAAYDVKNAIVDFNIYESLAKPYTTAQVTIADTKDILSGLDVQGGEYLDIELNPAETSPGISLTKRFYVMSIKHGIRAGESSEAVLLSCIDEIGFRSYLKNVNILLKGTSLEMLLRITEEYLDTNIIHNEEKYEQIHKIIVPNLTPLKTMAWINRKAITTIGMPHFLFGSFADDNLRYLDLEDLLKHDTINPRQPFTYGFTASPAKVLLDFGNQTFNIEDYSYSDNHDIAKIIESGMLSGKHSYYDTLRNREFNFDYVASRDAFNYMFDADLFNDEQKRVPIAPAMTMDNLRLEQYYSRNVYNIGSSVPWEDGYTAYGERLNLGAYVNDTTNEAMRYFMGKDTLNWKFNAKHFGTLSSGTLDGAHFLGKKLRVIFSKADPDMVSANASHVDMKKSGDYLISSIRHQMSKENYNVIVSGFKLSTLNASEYAP